MCLLVPELLQWTRDFNHSLNLHLCPYFFIYHFMPLKGRRVVLLLIVLLLIPPPWHLPSLLICFPFIVMLVLLNNIHVHYFEACLRCAISSFRAPITTVIYEIAFYAISRFLFRIFYFLFQRLAYFWHTIKSFSMCTIFNVCFQLH